MRKHMHDPVREQHKKLCEKLRGHYSYYGINGNYPSLRGFMRDVERLWRRWLTRRSRKRDMTWEKFAKLLARYPLPKPRIIHGNV